MVDTHDAGSKFLSKHRWRTKIFSNDDAPAKEPKTKPNYNNDQDVSDFLKPSTEKAQAHKEAAAAAFLAGANKPRIDVAKAQRWPGATDLLNSAAAGGKSPGIGGLKTGNRNKGLTVSFVRTQPEIIGHGGDECEEPSIEVFKRRKSNSLSDVDKLQTRSHQDDMNLGARSPKFNGMQGTNQEAAQRGIVTRTMTSHGEMSPPLKQKLEMGQINTHASPPPPPPQRMGQMGLGERPRPLARAPTGFDVQLETAGRPSMDSAHSYDSDNVSPVLSKKAPSLAPTLEEEEEFNPKPLKRTQTGWSDVGDDSDNEPAPPVPAVPRLPEVGLAEKEDDSPLDAKALLANRFLESEPSDPTSFSARVMHKMRAEEGRALHEAVRHGDDDSKRDSGSSSTSFQPGSVQSSNAFQVGTPPSSYAPLAGKTPPRLPSHEPPPTVDSPQRVPDADDPHRSRARIPSPARRPMPPGTYPIDTDPRPPSSSSSQYTVPSAASRTRGSPTGPVDPFSATTQSSIQQTPPNMEKRDFSTTSSRSILPTPPQFEQRPSYYSPPQALVEQPPAPPPHIQDPTAHAPVNVPPSAQLTVRPRQESVSPAPPASLARSDTKTQAEIAYRDFAERVQHMRGIFQLTAQLGGQLYDRTPMEWIRVAIWWFLRGRTGMEAAIRSRPRDGAPQPERLTQAHVDLAKAWWILAEVIQNHPKLRKYGDQRMETQARSAREAGDIHSAEVYEAHDQIIYYMKMLMGSMKRHESMPPTQALIQGQDQSIWIEYPNFAPDVASVLSGPASKSMLANGQVAQHLNSAQLIPVTDTKTDFCYFRMFVNASLSTDDPNTDRVPLPVAISVLRPREEYQVKLAICSQNELINLTVGANPEAGLTWRDVTWKTHQKRLIFHLRHSYQLVIDLNEADWRSLYVMVDHTNRVESNLRERSDERRSLKLTLREASYRDPTQPGVFPPERIKGCKLHVFEKFDRSSEGTGKRKLHRGYRVVMVTNPKNRTLSCVNHEMGTKQEPMNFEYNTEPDQAPAMTLRFREETPDKKLKICKMYLVFNDSKERNNLFGTFTSMNIAPNEAVFAQVPLKAFTIESADPAEGFSQSGHDVLKRLQWQEAKTMNQDPEAMGLESAPTVMSESLRIVCRHSAGIISDRMNLGPGDLLVRLPIDGAAELTLLRNPQQDMAVAIDASRTDKDIPDALANLLKTLTNASTIRRLTFNSFKDLHAFQLAVTGFQVIFDGIASTFSISRRRMVVPIYKQWTANTIRLQVVVQDNIVQLLAFFEEFSHADAMNFQLKSMDVFEKIEKNKQPCVRLVDAKFALPVEERRGEGKMGKEEGRLTGWAGMKRRFVCLDQIEYPGEHDDILISFDSVETRDRFAEALPAATEVGRKFTVRRKI